MSSRTSPICVPEPSPRLGAKKVGRRSIYSIPHLMTMTVTDIVQVVVCVVADGRLKINPRTRSVVAALGVYQDGVGTNNVNGKPVVS